MPQPTWRPGDEKRRGAEEGIFGMPDPFDDVEWLVAEIDRLCERRAQRGFSPEEHARFVVLCGLEADLLGPER
jgi:hypothetical protein